MPTEPLPQQYVIYDFNTFMADWGGYMGLALGYREFTSSLTKIDYMSFVIWNFFYCKNNLQ